MSRKSQDQLFREQQKDYGWKLPPKAALPLRLPIVRHIRGAWLFWHVLKHEDHWRSVGAIPGGYDRWVIHAIYRGWC